MQGSSLCLRLFNHTVAGEVELSVQTTVSARGGGERERESPFDITKPPQAILRGDYSLHLSMRLEPVTVSPSHQHLRFTTHGK
ncbi:UNVERIFIED_CONTAM: hypothetical protein FKN15_076492 [Acipenser sinensis]